MLTQPTCECFLDEVRRQLNDVIRPALSERPQLVALDMIDSILQNVSVRSEHEYVWLIEEIENIRDTASRIVADGHDPSGDIQRGVAELNTALPTAVPIAELREVYRRASSLLTTCIDGVQRPSASESAIARALELRASHEDEIRGSEFTMAGRG